MKLYNIIKILAEDEFLATFVESHWDNPEAIKRVIPVLKKKLEEEDIPVLDHYDELYNMLLKDPAILRKAGVDITISNKELPAFFYALLLEPYHIETDYSGAASCTFNGEHWVGSPKNFDEFIYLLVEGLKGSSYSLEVLEKRGGVKALQIYIEIFKENKEEIKKILEVLKEI